VKKQNESCKPVNPFKNQQCNNQWLHIENRWIISKKNNRFHHQQSFYEWSGEITPQTMQVVPMHRKSGPG